MAFRCCGKPGAGGTAQSKAKTEESIKKLGEDTNAHAVLTDMNEMFKMFDSNQNGLITKDEVLAAFKKMKIPIMAEEIMYMFMTYDTNGDNQLNYKEFANMMKDLLQTKEYPVEDMFKYFDADEDGFISVEEFMCSMHCLGIDVNDQKARELMAPFFSPGTEKINYENFLKLMKDIMV